MKNPAVPIGRLRFVLTIFLLQLGGCAVFRGPAPLVLPAGFAAKPEAAGLRNPAARQAAYKALFPQLQTVWAGGNLTASSRLRRGKDIVEFTYFSRNDAATFEHLLRMRGARGPVTLFDLIIRGRFATVILGPPNNLVFQGNIPAAGSPLADRFGVEPWDLVPIFTVGQIVAAGEFKSIQKKNEIYLTPVGGGDDLKQVDLDNLSGLPRRAEWSWNGQSYEVFYQGWDFFTDPLNETDTRLMPAQIQVRRRGLKLNLKMRAYHYDQQPTPKMFDVMVDQNYRVLPLEKLKSIF